MPRPHPPEFRRRAVELGREHAKPVKDLARDLGISESCLRNWMIQADVDEGRRDGTTSHEREELAELRRELRVAKMEIEILKRAAAFFAKENVLPNDLHLHLPTLRRPAGRGVLPGDGDVDLGVLRVAGGPGQRP
jgi:transposase